MPRIVPTAALALTLIGSPFSSSESESSPPRCERPARTATEWIGEVWDRRRWRRGRPRLAVYPALRHRLSCASGRQRRAIRRTWDRLARRYWRERRYQRLLIHYTPYGEWAIPAYVVWCESRFDWEAENPSGAIGPYQLLGQGAPWPIEDRWDRLAHDRIAYSLWRANPGAWVCA